MIYIKDDKRINIYAAFTDSDGIKRPAGWLVTPENRAAYGVTEVQEPVAPENPECFYRQELDVYPYVEYIERPIDELQVMFRAKVNEQRYQLERAGFPYGGKIFDSDQASFNRIQVAVTMAMISNSANVPFSIDWTTADNTVVTLDANQVLEMARALASYGTRIHVRARELKTAIDKCKSLAEILALNLDLTQDSA